MGPFGLVLIAAGAFVFWACSGFRGSFNDYMSARRDADWKYWKNFLAGFAVMMSVWLMLHSSDASH